MKETVRGQPDVGGFCLLGGSKGEVFQTGGSDNGSEIHHPFRLQLKDTLNASAGQWRKLAVSLGCFELISELEVIIISGVDHPKTGMGWWVGGFGLEHTILLSADKQL